MIKYLLVALFLSTSLYANEWQTNKDHSEVLFQVPYMKVSELTGRFNDYSGKAQIVNNDVTSLEVTISTSTIDTGNKMRDGHLQGNDFFQSKQFPHITFKSSKIVKIKPNTFKAEGFLTIKNINKLTTIEFTTTDTVKDSWGYENKFVKFKSNLNRKDFKINWNKTLDGKEYLVGDEVTFWGTFQMQPTSAATPNSKHMIPDTEYIRQRDDKRREEEESSISKKIRKLINGN